MIGAFLSLALIFALFCLFLALLDWLEPIDGEPTLCQDAAERWQHLKALSRRMW